MLLGKESGAQRRRLEACYTWRLAIVHVKGTTGIELIESCFTNIDVITTFINLRLFLVSKLIYGPWSNVWVVLPKPS